MKTILALLFSILSLTGCAALLVGTGGTLAIQEKTIGDSISDNTIWAKIKLAFTNQDLNHLLKDITISVSEGRVLLTGNVANHEDMVTILKIIWQQQGVRDVINEIKVHKNQSTIGSYAKDAWITTRIKSKMVISKNVHIKSINYSVETLDGVVYLFGIAQNREEIQAVEDIAYSISGVVDVKSFMRVKEDDIRNKLKKLSEQRTNKVEESPKEVVLSDDLNNVFDTE